MWPWFTNAVDGISALGELKGWKSLIVGLAAIIGFITAPVKIGRRILSKRRSEARLRSCFLAYMTGTWEGVLRPEGQKYGYECICNFVHPIQAGGIHATILFKTDAKAVNQCGYEISGLDVLRGSPCVDDWNGRRSQRAEARFMTALVNVRENDLLENVYPYVFTPVDYNETRRRVQIQVNKIGGETLEGEFVRLC